MITAEEIKAARALKRMTQKDLAEKADIGLGTIIRMESEKVGPGASSFEAVSKVMNVLGMNDD